MNCEHYSEDWETCTNADCPYCADYCPVTENPEVCRYSGLDDTEMMLRERLDEAVKWREDDLHEFTKKVDVLQREIERLKKQLVEVTVERDALLKVIAGEYGLCAPYDDCMMNHYSCCDGCEWEWIGIKEE